MVGVGMTEFSKPKTRNWDYHDMGRIAGKEALEDAGLSYDSIEAVVASYCYGEPTCGQRAVYELGLTGIPVFNVNNNCSSGSTALMLAKHLIESGMDCVLAIGFEKMERGLSEKYTDKISPVGEHMNHLVNLGASKELIPGLNKMTSEVIKMFAYAAKEYEEENPIFKVDDLVQIAYKNKVHGINNPKACNKRVPDKQSIGDTNRYLTYPITIGMSAPTADGGAAVIVCSENFLRKKQLMEKGVEIVAQCMKSDLPSSFGSKFQDLIGKNISKIAAENCYSQSGLRPQDIDVIECHDCFSCNELFMYESLGLASENEACNLLRTGKWIENIAGGKLFQIGDRWVVNPSGGLESKGHPLGATGLAQCYELVNQLRGKAGKRQVDGAMVGLQHNYGLGSAVVVTIYKKLFDHAQSVKAKL